jgi:16S rRNA processing protein RimM
VSAPHLQVGYVSRAHGLGGEVVIRTFDPASATLLEVERVLLRAKDGKERELKLSSARMTSADLLVQFGKIGTREAAKALVGSTVLVFREDLPAPEEGEYFLGDLVGLQAVSEDGQRLGVVEEVWDSGPVPNLVIREEGKEHLVPFAEAYCPEVDLDGRRIVVRLPEYAE